MAATQTLYSAPVSVSPDEFRQLMGSFASGVTVVTSLSRDGEPKGLTASAFSSLCKDPPLCLVCISHTARARSAMMATRKFAVNILDESQQALSNHFASTKDDKFETVAWESGLVSHCPILPGALAWAECEVEIVHPSHDHDIFVGRILNSHVQGGKPLMYWRGTYTRLAT